MPHPDGALHEMGDARQVDEFARRESTITPTILTSQGTYFNFVAPRESEINVTIIAHALSNLCRFTGHCREFYSVAQHAVLVSMIVPPELAYFALHHDDAEAFVGDVASPLKKMLPGYKEIERYVEAEVFRRMSLPATLPPEVKRADLVALRTEQRDLMHKAGGLWTSLDGIEPADIRIAPLSPRAAFELYMDRHTELFMNLPGHEYPACAIHRGGKCSCDLADAAP
jgi:hypothetical protein